MEPSLQVKNISKAFSGVQALNNISINFVAGKVHVLLGENGAGKSTLIKIISGVYQKDSGQIFMEGKEINPHSPREGIDFGISVIHQELSVVTDLTVAENIYLDDLPKTGKFLVNYKTMNKKAKELLDRLNVTNIAPQMMMRNLTVASRQMVEIARAISRNARVVIMDEPTSSLSDKEIHELFNVVKSLKEHNVVVIYISHKLNEISTIGDDISVFKDGNLVATREVAGLSEQEMVKMMVGRSIGEYYVRASKPEKRVPVLQVKNLCGKGFSNISFELYKGEVLGFSGLIGAGRTELMMSIFGAERCTSGEIYVHGRQKMFRHPQEAIREGIGMLPEDRRHQGVILDTSVKQNISIVSLKKNARHGWMNLNWENAAAEEYISKLKIKTPSAVEHTRNLSGGNQQKVVLAKWLAAQANILILDEPTKGIDVNAKAEIYQLISDFVKNGGSVILISSELPEVIGVSQRIIVMHEGKMTGMVEGAEMQEDIIMKYATSLE